METKNLDKKDIKEDEHFCYNCNRPICKGDIPPTVTHLIFGDNYNKPICKGVLPNGLTHLTFGHEFNQVLVEGVLPSNLTHLTFGRGFDLETYFIEYSAEKESVEEESDEEESDEEESGEEESDEKNKSASAYGVMLPNGLAMPNSLEVLVFAEYYRQSDPINVPPNCEVVYN